MIGLKTTFYTQMGSQMKASLEHAELLKLVFWIDQNTSGIELPNDERHRLAIGCLDVALEHQAAIAKLHSIELYGSMLALLRCETESVVRGLWLLYAASQEDIERFKCGNVKKSFNAIVKELEQKIDQSSGIFSVTRKEVWTVMNDFTHTGYVQVSGRHRPGSVRENYSEGQLALALSIVGLFGLLAAEGLLDMAISPDKERLQQIAEKIKSYADKLPTG